MKRFWKWPLLSLHVLAWAALAVAAYSTAGPYRFANCWHLIPIYIPPAQILLVAIAVVSPVAVLMSFFYPSLRGRPAILLAWHGVIVMAGLFACSYAAYTAAGPVSCL